MNLNEAVNAIAQAAQAAESDVEVLVNTLRRLTYAVDLGVSAASELAKAWDILEKFKSVPYSQEKTENPSLSEPVSATECVEF